MAEHSWMNLARIFLVLQAAFVVANSQAVSVLVASEQNLTTTTRAEDYVIQNQRQYAANILSYESQLAEFKLSYQQQLNAIAVQTTLVEDKLSEVEEKLNPLELLDDLSKHCVQKYRIKIAKIATVKASLASCAATASNVMASLVAPAETTMRNLINYYAQLNTNLNACKQKFENLVVNYTLCVTPLINTANSVTKTNQKTFATQIQELKCSGTGRITQSLDCSFTILYNTISVIGETTRLIDNCIAGLEYCPPCQSAPVDSCPHSIDLTISDLIYKNATIKNPFYGLNSTVPCIKIYFVPPA
ncbi:uncharacterized protein LOC119679933 [Teleopsis dalmanni]|uniref:uncharacterized protein LOC119679933 n=1 Tax=Teleopsis dalmanni TaxID=139649 RepID=UPI000D32B68F|nr:uncharacterized protein LOC119679933 [Teleopsis dalmanni]